MAMAISKAEQVALTHGTLVEQNVEDVAAGLLVIEGVVLDVAHDVVGLETLHEIAAEEFRRGWVFAEVFEIAPLRGSPCDIDASADGHVIAWSRTHAL